MGRLRGFWLRASRLRGGVGAKSLSGPASFESALQGMNVPVALRDVKFGTLKGVLTRALGAGRSQASKRVPGPGHIGRQGFADLFGS